jgi:FkbM family methyltransferase
MSILHKSKLLRRAFLPILKAMSRDVSIKHPWVTSETLWLNSFRHKGYWYHGKKREYKSMNLFSKIIKPGGLVIEVGGHIGYVSIFFSSLVGAAGRVIVFEPGSNNLPYIKKNIRNSGHHANIELMECAAGAAEAVATLYEESLTGQNNSLLPGFNGLKANEEEAFVGVDVVAHDVPVTTLDAIVFGSEQDMRNKDCSPKTPISDVVDFIKIDVEGFEWNVLKGAVRLIKEHQPVIMVEIQSDHEYIFDFLNNQGYRFFNDIGEEQFSHNDLRMNTFCFHKNAHSRLIIDLFR